MASFGEQNQAIAVLVAVGLPILALMWYLQRTQRRDRPDVPRHKYARQFALILIAGAALRLWLAYSLPGHTGDIDYFREWALEAYGRSFDHFYDGDFYCDYPPMYIYVLYILGFIRSLLGLDYWGTDYAVLLRLPSILAELLIACFFFQAAYKRLGGRSALMLCMLIVFNPAVLLNAAVWGQIDSLLALLLLGVFWLLYKKQYIWSAVLFTVGFLMKPQVLFAGPVMLYAFIGHIVLSPDRRKAWLDLIVSIAAVVLLFFLIPLPFTIGRGPLWLIELYRGTISTYPFATMNAFNLYGVAGLNLVDATEASFGGITAQHWGILAAIAICIYGGWLYWKNHRGAYLFVLNGFIWTAVFMLVHSMHERYLYAAPFFFLAGYVLMRDPRLLDSSVLLFALVLVDQGVTLAAYGALVDLPAALVEWMSLAGLLCFAYVAWTSTSIAFEGPCTQIPSPAEGPRRRLFRRLSGSRPESLRPADAGPAEAPASPVPVQLSFFDEAAPADVRSALGAAAQPALEEAVPLLPRQIAAPDESTDPDGDIG
ncbi:MAG: hypothetical protein HDQ87_09290 [Clostridia bacterium]|nr:hypothetical protein [Clostridia bacterium]